MKLSNSGCGAVVNIENFTNEIINIIRSDRFDNKLIIFIFIFILSL